MRAIQPTKPNLATTSCHPYRDRSRVDRQRCLPRDSDHVREPITLSLVTLASLCTRKTMMSRVELLFFCLGQNFTLARLPPCREDLGKVKCPCPDERGSDPNRTIAKPAKRLTNIFVDYPFETLCDVFEICEGGISLTPTGSAVWPGRMALAFYRNEAVED